MPTSLIKRPGFATVVHFTNWHRFLLPGNMSKPLHEIIIQKIKTEGAISFRDFMDMSLYYPGLGYYTSHGDKIGRNGDYYTSPELTPAFGAMIGRQIEEMWEILGKETFTIVEYGAGTGRLCNDVLDHLKLNPQLYENLRYCIIEKSESMREKEKQRLHEKVSWHDSINDISGITGCVLSNELADNFPVHRVVMGDELMEVFVDHQNGFVEVLQPAAPALKEYVSELKINLPKGYRTEINLSATQWIKEVAPALKKGYVITIDYGYPSCELYSEYRNSGTLMCYNKHNINCKPYDNIGEQDITTHVNFSALCHYGLKNGLACCGLTNQANFLLALGFKNYLVKRGSCNPDIAKTARQDAYLTHTLLVDMGTRFKVLIQRKGVDQPALQGLKVF